MSDEAKKKKNKVKKLIIDRDLCIGAAACTVLAPDVYKMDDENKAVLLDGWEVLDRDDEYHIEAAQSCPVEAIFLEEEDGTQIYP